MWLRFPFLLWAMTMLVGIDSARSVQAQDTAKPVRRAPRTFQRAFVATDLVSEPVAADEVAGTDGTRERLERRLAWEIKRLDQFYGLTAEQKKKLEVAGRGDIKRLFERIRAREERLRRAPGGLQAIPRFRQTCRGHAPDAGFNDEQPGKTLCRRIAVQQDAQDDLQPRATQEVREGPVGLLSISGGMGGRERARGLATERRPAPAVRDSDRAE